VNKLQIFENKEFGQIRTIEEDGRVLFCGKDIVTALGYKDTTNAMKQHCRGVVKHHLADSLGRNQEMNFIPEGDICRLAAKSELPGAERFESWIFDEVLPSIRKTGAYLTPALVEEVLTNPDTLIKLATQLKEARAEAQKLLPKAEFYDTVTGANCRSVVDMGACAKVINYRDVGRNKLFEILRDEKILMPDNIPYQRYVDSGCFRVIESKYNRPNGDTDVYFKTVVYQKGIAMIKRILDKRGYIAY